MTRTNGGCFIEQRLCGFTSKDPRARAVNITRCHDDSARQTLILALSARALTRGDRPC
jgi:hypothetical protein